MDDTPPGCDAGEDADECTVLARTRTTEAEIRTVLANERTFSAWLRTSMSAIAGGLVVAKVEATVDHPLAPVIGVIMILAGLLMAGVALVHYLQVYDAVRYKRGGATPYWLAVVMSVGLMVAGVLSLVLVMAEG